MQKIVVPKTRKPKFELLIRILDLNNIPYVSGRVTVKWNCPHSHSTSSSRTNKAAIKDHKALFDHEEITTVRLVIDKNNWLQEAPLEFHVIHEVPTAGKEDRSLMGIVKVNLAEYVEACKNTTDPVQRRYLLQQSRINSTLKIALHMTQIEGERNFMAPQLKSAPQFVGIAGIVNDAQIETDDSPTPNPTERETGDELRELYRKTLAAELTCASGDPSADQVIEDIFAGGNGWGLNRDGSDSTSGPRLEEGGWSDGEARVRPHKTTWPDFGARKMIKPGRESIGSRQTQFGRRDRDDWNGNAGVDEVDEFDARDDMKCWLNPPQA